MKHPSYVQPPKGRGTGEPRQKPPPLEGIFFRDRILHRFNLYLQTPIFFRVAARLRSNIAVAQSILSRPIKLGCSIILQYSVSCALSSTKVGLSETPITHQKKDGCGEEHVLYI